MKKRFLSLLLTFAMVLSLFSAMGISAAAATSPVTVTSKAPTTGAGNVTELNFQRTAGDDTKYKFFVSLSSAQVTELAPLLGADPSKDDDKWEIIQKFSADPDLVPDDPGTTYIVSIQDLIELIAELRQLAPELVVSKPYAVWIVPIDDATDEPLFSEAVEALTTLNYFPGVTNTNPANTRLVVGDTPIATYKEPTGEYTAEFTWYDTTDPGTRVPLVAGDTFQFGHKYDVEVNITVSDGYAAIEPGTKFYFGEDDARYDPSEPNLIFSNIPVELSTDANQIMAVGYHSNNFDISGKYGGTWKQTTFGNAGFRTYLYIGSDVENNYDSASYIYAVNTSDGGYSLGDLNTAIDFTFLSDGQVLQVQYTVKNDGASDVTYSIGSGADIQIGEDDGAVITEFTDGSGFEMVSTSPLDKDADGNAAQLNFWCMNAKGVTNVDHFWYGSYGNYKGTVKDSCTGDAYDNFIDWSSNHSKAIFTPEKKNRLSFTDENFTGSELDSAATWSWANRTIPAGETQVYTVLFAIGGPGSEDLVAGDFTNVRYVNDTITYSGDLDFNVNAIKVNDVVIDASTYTVNKTDKTIRFDVSAGLKARKTVAVVLGTTEIPVRNTIKAEGPKAILLYYGDGDDDYVILDDDNLYLNKEGNGPGSENDYSLSYDSTAGEAKLNGCDIEKLEIPSDGDTPDGSVTLKMEDDSKIKNVTSDYPLTLTGTDETDPETLTVEEIKTTGLTVESANLIADTITADGKIAVDGGSVTAEEVNAEKLEISDGDMTINATSTGITCDELTVTGGTLTINLPNDGTGSFMSVGKIVIPDGYEVVGGTIDNQGNFTPDSGATQLLIRPKSGCPKNDTCILTNYTDTDPNMWYHDGLHYCVDNAILIGTTDKTLNPLGSASRREFVVMLWRMAGEPSSNYTMKYTDVPSDNWSTEAIRWATEKGLVTGCNKEGTLFCPTDPITREQAMTILCRYAEKIDHRNVSTTFSLDSFTDAADVSTWARDSVKWCCSKKDFIRGTSATNSVLNPKATATRAELACLIQRYSEMAPEKSPEKPL